MSPIAKAEILLSRVTPSYSGTHKCVGVCVEPFATRVAQLARAGHSGDPLERIQWKKGNIRAIYILTI